MSICKMFFVLLFVTAVRNNEVLLGQVESLTLALATIITEFHAKQCSTIFISSSSTNPLDGTHATILQNIFTKFDKNVAVSWILNDQKNVNGIMERTNNIVLIDSFQSFRAYTESFDYFEYYTVVLTNVYENLDVTDLTNILEDCWNNHIVNVNILNYSQATGTVLLQTYFPFTSSHCRKVVPVIWNYIERSDFLQPKHQLFPSKTNNLYNCPVSILVAPIAPYIFVTQNATDDGITLEGSEQNLLHALSEKLNFKPNVSVHWDLNIRGIFGMVRERKVDFTLGALIYSSRMKMFLGTSNPYSFDSMLLVLPNPRPYSGFEKLFFPFTLSTWILLLVTLVIASIVIKVLELEGRKYYEFVVGSNISSPYLNLIHVLLTGGGLSDPIEILPRFLLMLWILLCMILQTVYNGQLFNFIKENKMMDSVQSMEELIEQNITIKIAPDSFEGFLKFDKRIVDLLHSVDANTKWEYTTDKEAYITLEMQLVDETRQKRLESIVYLRPKTLKIATYPHLLYLQKHSFLKKSIDVEISYMHENGLTDKWNSPYKTSAMLPSINLNIPRKLNISQLLGIMEVCFGLLIVAFVLFILEILSFYF